MLKRLSRLIALLLGFACNITYADFYSDCIKGVDFGGSIAENIMLTPLNSICQDQCDRQCKSFSRTINNGQELNRQVITDCQTACQNGEYFESQYYEAQDPKATPPVIEIKPKVKIHVVCDDQIWAKNNIYTTRFKVSNGDKIRLVIAGGTDDNKIYLCGKKDVALRPIFNSPKASDWDNGSKQTLWQSKTQHACLYDVDDNEWSNLTNVKLWSLNYLPLSSHYEESYKQSYSNPYGPCKWSARNYNYTDTGLYIADGDELSISWSGLYGHNMNVSVANMTTNEMAQCMSDPTVSLDKRNKCSAGFYDDSSIQIKPPSQTGFGAASIPSIVLTGEAARLSPIGTVSFSNAEGPKILGLEGGVLDDNKLLKVSVLKTLPGCSDDRDNFTKAECVKIDNIGRPLYTYTGVLEGFSNTRSSLGLRHFDGYTDANTLKSWYADNFGGYDVDISWGGCPKYNGESVQYTVAGNVSEITENMWKDVPMAAFQKDNYLNINTSVSGTLYFRIKTLTPPAGAAPQVVKMYTSPGSYFGQYFISAEKVDSTGGAISQGPITKLVRNIHGILLGSEDQTGSAQKIFTSVTRDQKYIGIVRALLVVYLSFFGVGFIIGIVKLNQQEAAVRLVKIGVILALISPTSWEFFSTYLVNIFIYGGIELIALMVSGSFSRSVVDISHDPFLVFSLFDGPLDQIFSSAVWKKIYALICTGLLGFVVALVIIYSAFKYVMSLLKATLVYIYSLIGIAILIITAPVFLCCMLFSLTKDIFDNWWKYLISYTLQPVMVFASIAIFNLLIMVLLYSCLNFTACQFCLLGLNLGDIYNECWIPGYQTTLALNTPGNIPSFFLPGTVLSSGLAFAMIAHAMYEFIGFISGICNSLVTGQFVRESTASKAANETIRTAKNYGKAAFNTAMKAGSMAVGGVMGDTRGAGAGGARAIDDAGGKSGKGNARNVGGTGGAGSRDDTNGA